MKLQTVAKRKVRRIKRDVIALARLPQSKEVSTLYHAASVKRIG